MRNSQPVPFSINIPSEAIADLKSRLANTRWPPQIAGSGWSAGTDTGYLQQLTASWLGEYDWREREKALNLTPQFTVDIDGLKIHFVHIRAKDPGECPAVPLLMLHGWPGSFLQMAPVLSLLTQRERPGDGVLFDVVVPSLPGFGLSGIPDQPGMSVAKIAPLLHSLMTQVLGYSRFGIRASDLGAGVASNIGAKHPADVIGIHTGGTNPWLGKVPEGLSVAEAEYVKTAQAWMQSEMAYAQLHSTKPQTLANALNDTPAGMASWMVEKYWRWGDTRRSVDDRFGRTSLLDSLTLYWVTQTIGSSMRLYYESMRDSGSSAKADVPTAMLMSPFDMFPTPRAWAERQGRIDRWTEIDRGGHFLEWEVPDLVAKDLRAFFGSLRA